MRAAPAIAIAAAAALASSAAAAPPPTARKVTLAEAIALATRDNIQIVVGKEKVVSASEKVESTRTRRLPSLSLRGNAFVWNESIEIQFPGMAGMPPQTLTVRDQITASVEVSVAQPITAALVLGTLIDVDQASVDAARAELTSQQLDLAYQTAEAYLGALQARTLRDVATTSVTQIEANLERARALRTAGVLFDVDVLRLEATRAQLRQQVLEAEVGAETARRGLAFLLGLADGVALELVDVDTSPPALSWTEDQAVAAAVGKRPETRLAASRAAQADLGIDVARAQYLPNVNAIATYSHNEGQGPFATKDSGFVGVTLDWNLWDWGRRGADLAQARSASRQARAYRDFVASQIALDVRNRWLRADTARKTLDVSESGLKAAEEAYRLQNVRFAQGAATTTDVIGAETDVARARGQAAVARYQYLLAWMAVVRAVGEMPSR